jgi:hypothetical protein
MKQLSKLPLTYTNTSIYSEKEKVFAHTSNYDGLMDTECIKICNYLNSLPSVKTSNSCCGHGSKTFSVFFECTDWRSLAFLGRCIDQRYFEYGNDIEIRLSNSDINNNFAVFELHTISSMGDVAFEKISSLCKNMVVHLNHTNYMEFFMSDFSGFLIKETKRRS